MRGPRKAKRAKHVAKTHMEVQMKTTVDIADPLLREARKLAAREGVALRALIERGLHRVLAETKPAAGFKLRRASFKGKGLAAELRDVPWERLRDLTYDGRGA